MDGLQQGSERSTLPGTAWHTDGMRQGRRHPFTLLLGVALSHVPKSLSGNLAVFPSSHHVLHDLMLPGGRLRGFDDDESYSVAAATADDPWCKKGARRSGGAAVVVPKVE